MTILRTLVVDDEPLARGLLTASLDDIAQVEVVGECKNGREAVQAVLDLSPDLIFLDIQMPGMNGFDVVKALQADVMPMVIFATAYDQYAVDAFDVHAIDYILKPLEEDRLLRAVQRAVESFEHNPNHADNKKPLIGAIGDIAANTHQGGNAERQLADRESAESHPRKLAIKDSDEVTMVAVADIDWVDAAGDYMCIHVQGETHIMRSTLKALLDKLDPGLFKRVHRSTIVNLDRIEKVIPHTKGECFITLDCGERLKVSRNYRQAITQFLADSG